MKINACEICKNSILTDVHHIQSISLNGPDVPWNKCELCPNCHRLVHLGVVVIEGRFFTSDCKLGETELVWRLKDDHFIVENENDSKVFLLNKQKNKWNKT